jgi:hypothetical protein
MKKINVFTVILTVLFVTSFLAKELHSQTSGNKWEIKSVSGPASCKLNGHELTFKVKIKNISNVISTGEKVTIKFTISHNGQNLLGDEADFTSGLSGIGVGKSTTLSILVNNENFTQFTNSIGSKTINTSFQLVTETTVPAITKSFTIKVK